jgi:N-glycosylase/DNA lyase
MAKEPLMFTPEDFREMRAAVGKFKGNMLDEQRFYELCFVLCASQAKIGSNQIVNNNLKFMDFYNKGALLEDLVELCKLVRFKNRKAQYLQEAWYKKDEIFEFIDQMRKGPAKLTYYVIRRGLVERIKGLSYKTASQFLRNAYGVKELAILDVHILRWMGEKPPTTLRQYERIEGLFQYEAKQYHLSPAELDAFLFVRGSGILWKDLR